MYKKAFELSYKNKKVEIEIQDFVGDVRNINGTEDLFSLSYISDSKDKGQSILVTEADINFYADDYFNIDELKTVGETDIKVKYYEDDALLWSGFVIPDFFSTSVDIAPVVSMVATDRIGTLKEISNNAESNTPIQILASCLKQTGQDLPINLIADNNHFETPIQLERIEEVASYDVIRTFMVLFNCKITLYKNAWWIINKKLLESGFVNYKSYDSDGVGGSITPYEQELITLDLANRGGQREIKPTASEVSLFLEFGGSKKYPENWDFEEWNGSKFEGWESVNGFVQRANRKVVDSYSVDAVTGDINANLGTNELEDLSLWNRNRGFFHNFSGDEGNYITKPHLKSTFSNIPFIGDKAEVEFKANFTSVANTGVTIVPLIKIVGSNVYYAIDADGSVKKLGATVNLKGVMPILLPTSQADVFEAVQSIGATNFKFDRRQLGIDNEAKAELQVLLFGSSVLIFSEIKVDMFIHSLEIEYNKSEVTGKGLIFKIKQGGEKFSKSRETETILFSDKINQGVNGHFYNYKYDDTSIVDLPSEFALTSVRERADMFSKARDYYSLDGNFIVNPLAKYTCGLKSFVLIGGQNRREDAGIVIEEIVSNTLNRTDFIYTYFDDGKDKVKTIGTASGGSSSSGGGGGVSSPQLWKVDEDGNIYTEYNAYSLKELSAFGFEEEQGGGGGGSMNMMQDWAFTTETENYYLPAKLAVPFYNDTRSRLSTLEAGEGGQVIVDWEAITGKPDTFAPSAHTHTFASLTSKPTTLAGYGITDGASKVHTHAISDVTILQATLNLKANLASPMFTGVVTAPTFVGNLNGSMLRLGDNRNSFTPAMVPNFGLIQTFSTQGALASQINDYDYSDVIAINSYEDASVGRVNALSFDKSSYRINHFMGTFGASTWLGFKTLAYITDNVASATTLQTPRTLWGQSFNGEANVSGAMTGVTTLSMTGALTGATILNASQNVNTPKVSFGNGWTAEGVGSELQFKLNGVIQAKIVNGALVSTGEVTAFY